MPARLGPVLLICQLLELGSVLLQAVNIELKTENMESMPWFASLELGPVLRKAVGTGGTLRHPVCQSKLGPVC